ncbi:hypothetical protein [Solirubrobacter soli]|uniref:hypothetical protein n=1 Tax=Solirubrobacter soli TaxID=363832 RepID=UPI0004041137|nr:hypothetical protein [Solirubrobacter soli]
MLSVRVQARDPARMAAVGLDPPPAARAAYDRPTSDPDGHVCSNAGHGTNGCEPLVD